jgi:hypothetical protein
VLFKVGVFLSDAAGLWVMSRLQRLLLSHALNHEWVEICWIFSFIVNNCRSPKAEVRQQSILTRESQNARHASTFHHNNSCACGGDINNNAIASRCARGSADEECSRIAAVLKTQWRTKPSSAKGLTLPSIEIIGDPIPIWSAVDTWKKCHLIDVPDTPARACIGMKNTNNRFTPTIETNIQMICRAVGYHEMHGPSLFNQTRSCRIAWNATKDPDPSQFAGNEFLDAPFLLNVNGMLVALIHTEYPGNNYNACNVRSHGDWEHEHDLTRSKRIRQISRQQRKQHRNHQPLRYPTCWTVTIGLAISHDFGYTWQHIAEPPFHLVAAVPYTYHQEYSAYGWGDPSNIVQHDGHFYATMWNRNQVGKQPPGICVMRTNNLLAPKLWSGWN